MAEVNVWRMPERCIVRDNSKLRKMIGYRIKERGINQTLEKAKIDKRNFYTFLKGDYRKISQSDVIKLCDLLDIKITFNAEFL